MVPEISQMSVIRNRAGFAPRSLRVTPSSRINRVNCRTPRSDEIAVSTGKPVGLDTTPRSVLKSQID